MVIREDGSIEEVADASVAAEMATQRHVRKELPGRRVVRVVQQLPISWVPAGLRLVDTPGLDDPNDAALYEELTLAELDRVAAAVFVFCSPPGPAGEELRLLRALGERGVDKAFLVCNFYPDHWSDQDTRHQVSEYIESVVSGAAGGGVRPDDVRVYAVSARDGLAAAQRGSPDDFASSGMEALRADLERFLAADALPRLLSAATQRVRAARDVLLDAVLERKQILTNPHILDSVRETREGELADSRGRLAALVSDTVAQANELDKQLVDHLTEPYRHALSELDTASDNAGLGQIEHRLRLRLETAASRASLLFGQTTAIHEERVRRQLFDSFGIADRLGRGTSTTPEWSRLAEDAGLGVIAGNRPDWATAGAAGAATAVGGALVGGSLAGGVGLALLATGPVGWIIGAAAGGVLGLLAGGAGGAMATRRTLSDADRATAKASLISRRGSATDTARSSVRAWSANVEHWLTNDADRFLHEHNTNLERVTAILRDETGRQTALQQMDALSQRLRSVI